MIGLPVLVNLNAYHGDSWSQTFRFLEGSIPQYLTGATVAAGVHDGAGAMTAIWWWSLAIRAR